MRSGVSKSAHPNVPRPNVGARHGYDYSPFSLAHFLFTYSRTASMAGHIWKQKRCWAEGDPAWRASLLTPKWYSLGSPKSPGGSGAGGASMATVTGKVHGRAWTRLQVSCPSLQDQ